MAISFLARPLARKLLAAHPHDFDFLYLSGILENQGGQFAAGSRPFGGGHRVWIQTTTMRTTISAFALAELKDFTPAARAHSEKALALGATEPQVHFKLCNRSACSGRNRTSASSSSSLYQKTIRPRSTAPSPPSSRPRRPKNLPPAILQKAVAALSRSLGGNSRRSSRWLTSWRSPSIAREIPQRSAPHWSRQSKLDPGFALAQNQLGYLASHSGDSASAEEHFRLAVQAAPGYTQAWISLAATLGMESRFPEAQEALASALKLEPDNAEALQLRKDLTAAQEQR